MKTTEELELIDIDKLIPYANNAKTHSKAQINKLIRPPVPISWDKGSDPLSQILVRIERYIDNFIFRKINFLQEYC